jgi:hypothetical protein
MTLDAADKEWVEGLVNKLTSATNQGDGRNGDDKEFLLHLYDQLWENMRAKENRLWSFLSLYGAAVGLVFAGGQASGLAGAELFALIIVMGLTAWAVLIMLNANFWIRRNLLMVGGIEKKYPGIAKGIYPRSFPEGTKGSFDALYRGSILVLSIMLLLFFARAIWPYRNPASFDTFHIFLSVVLIYMLFASFALYCLKQHEYYVTLNHSTKREQLLGAEQFTLSKWNDVLDGELNDRKKVSVRPYLLLLLLCVITLFDFILIRNGYTWPYFLWCIIPQALLITAFCWQWFTYRRPYKLNTALTPLLKAAKTELLVKVKPKWDSIKSNSAKRDDLKTKFDELASQIDTQINSLESANDWNVIISCLDNLKNYVQSLKGLDDSAINAVLVDILADLNNIGTLPTGADNSPKAVEVDNIADVPLDVKWYMPESVKISVILVILSVVNPVYFLYTNRPKLREDFTSGTKTVSATDLNQQIEKAQQDLKKIESSFQELQNAETQRQLIDQRLVPLQQRLDRLESQQQEMLKPPSTPIPRSTP